MSGFEPELPGLEPDPAERAQLRIQSMRIAEAILFAAPAPLSVSDIARRLPPTEDCAAVLQDLKAVYAARGINLIGVAGLWMFRTAPDLGYLLQPAAEEPRKLSRAAMETLAIIAYHQPVTRAEIEEIRGVTVAKGTLDVLMETGWVRMRGRRKTPGRPITFGVTEAFLIHFGLESLGDLPGLDELRGAGLLEGTVPPGFRVPPAMPVGELLADEDPLDAPDLLDYSSSTLDDSDTP